jgi:hypothetical protein
LSTFKNYTPSEPRFRALLNKGGSEQLEFGRAYRALRARLENDTDAMTSMRICTTRDLRFCALLVAGAIERVKLAKA